MILLARFRTGIEYDIDELHVLIRLATEGKNKLLDLISRAADLRG